jgi:DNA-binding Lrp family transcriptional regulator
MLTGKNNWDPMEEVDCLKYFMLVSSDKDLTHEQIAEELGFGRTTLFMRLRKWRETGLYDYIEAQVSQYQIDMLYGAVQSVIRDYQKIILKIRDDALDDKSSPANRLRAAKFLTDNIVKPYFDNANEGKTAEMAYLESDQNFSPTLIPHLVGNTIIQVGEANEKAKAASPAQEPQTQSSPEDKDTQPQPDPSLQG